MIRWHLLLFAVCSAFSNLLAQEYNLRKLQTEQKLSNDHVQAIFKDSDGYMWFGTSNGLNRYDGTTIKSFLADKGDSSALFSNDIYDIFEGIEGDLWLKNEDSIFNVFSKNKGVFIRDFKFIKDQYKLKSQEVSKIYVDSQKRLWFLHPFDGLTLYFPEKDESKFLISKPSKSASLSHNNVTDIQEDLNGNIWLVYDNGTLDILSGKSLKITGHFEIKDVIGPNQSFNFKIKLDNKGDAWVFCPDFALGVFYLSQQTKTIKAINEKSQGLKLNNSLVKAVMPRSNGEVWIGTDHGGINIIDANKSKVRYLLNQPDNPYSLSHNAVYALFEDDQGIVWVGTHKKGVELYHPDFSRFGLVKREIDLSKPYPVNDVNAFEEDGEGNIFIGTNGGGLWQYNPENGAITDIVRLGKSMLPKDLVVVDLLTDSEGVLWIGTYQNGLYAYEGESLIHFDPGMERNAGTLKDNNIWNLYEDSKKRLWIGTLREGLFLYDKEKNSFVQFTESGKGMALKNLYITGITEDEHGNIWSAGIKGIDVFNPETGHYQYFPGGLEDESGLSSNEVSDLIADKHGIIWVSTHEGLCYYDEQASRFVFFDQSDGLKNEFLVSLVADYLGNIWLSSQKGIIHAMIDRSGSRLKADFRLFNERDGLQGDYFNKNAMFIAEKGDIYFGGSNGFNFVDPTTFSFHEEEPQVVFSGFSLFNRSISVNERVNGRILLKAPLDKSRSIQLNHDENIFSVSFSSMNYLNPQKSSFQYKLEGFRNDWTNLSEAPFEVTFTNLDPGKYQLLVKASSIDGIPGSEAASLAIEVLAPFWKTGTAYLIYTISFFLLMLALWRWLVGKERLRLRRQGEIKEIQRRAELDQMKSKFFTNISHEFRTPLTLILAPLDQLKEEYGEGPTNFHLKTIHQNAHKLLTLVNQLMDLRNIETQTLQMVKAEGDIIALIKEQVLAFQSLAINSNIELSFSTEIEKLACSFDSDKVEKIINNLLSNAFKFTCEGGRIGVRLSFYHEESRQGVLKIEVKDTGIGIPEHLRKRVFERYYTTNANQNQGTGIGLSLVDEFTKMHGGSVCVESELGHGTTFTVTLPLELRKGFKPLGDEPFLSTDEELEEKTGKELLEQKPRLLLVEDNVELRQYLHEVLKEDYLIDQAANGEKALRIAQEKFPDIILSDIMMPEMDGVTLCKHIKNNLKTSHIPVVLLTAKTAEEAHLSGMASGCNLYLEKPFNLTLLRSGLQNLLEEKTRLQQHYQKVISVQTSEPELQSLDDKLIQRAIALVEKEIENPDFSVESLSKELGMSRMHFYKKCNALTGQSPLEFIRSIRLQRAAQLLKQNQFSVSEVAYQVGFNNAKYFSKHFKSYFGTLPSQYQKQYKNDA
jgi:signal transduction histidine kinase/DNA-binding response OmpR family regulator/sugar lactone lactonase YvrE